MRPPQRGELVVFCHQLLIRRHASILRRALVTRLETAQAVHVRIGAGIFWLRRGRGSTREWRRRSAGQHRDRWHWMDLQNARRRRRREVAPAAQDNARQNCLWRN